MRKLIFIILFALLNVLGARAYDFKVGGVYYDTISGKKEVRVTSSGSYDSKYTGTVVIPATVEYEGSTYSVTSIGGAGF